MMLFEADNLRVEVPAEGLAVLSLDVKDRSLNVLSRQVLADLAAAFDRVNAEPGIRTLLIRSAKPTGFLAGADLNEFAGIGSAAEASAVSATGQQLFDKLANLRPVTVALVVGACLGGGLELALACDYRAAIDHPKTQFGLPEIELGLLPGWGGTQRLPRVVGLERALRVILGSQRLGPRDALRWGLVDAVLAGEPADPTHWPSRLAFAQGGKRPRKGLPLRTWRQKLLESNPLGRRLILGGTERLLRQKVPDDMPAPSEALEAVRIGVNQGMEAGLAREREAIGRLATTPACRNLIGLFFARESARQVPGEDAAAPLAGRVAVVGAGVMGAGIAQLAAFRGLEVVVQEINEEALGAGLLRITGLFEKAQQRGLLSPEEVRRRLALVKGTTSWQGFDEAEVVIEAAVEDLEAKRAVFRELDVRTKPTAILATNTSSLPVAALAEGLAHPERVAGLHFFNPVHKMPLVEVVRAPATGEGVIAALRRLAVHLGKTPVVVKDSPGFVVNRVLMPYLHEAVLLVAEGLDIEEVDRTMRRFGMPMGPLELLDQVGLDVAAHVAKAVRPAFEARFPPSDALERMRDCRWLGQKNSIGFYQYQGKKRVANESALPVLRPEKPLASMTAALPPTARALEARERMVLLMVNEAALCLSDRLVADAASIDLAMVLGTGWAPHRGGPLHYADDRGLADVVQRLTELAGRLGPRFDPCEELRRRAAAREPFHSQLPLPAGA